MALGRPISLTNNVASKIIRVLATNNQTVFTVPGGYRINQIGVFRNGVRLSNNSDFTALDGSTVTLINAAQTSDELLFEIQDDFRVSDAIVSAASTQTISGDLSITGDVSIGGSISGTVSSIIAGNNISVSGATGDVTITGLANTSTINADSLNVTGISTVAALNATSGTFSGNVSVGGTLTYEDVTNIDSVGIITARSDVSIADKIIHTGDTNTAIRFPAADTFTVETAGSEALRIDSSGRLLVGATVEGAPAADNLTLEDSGSCGLTIRAGTSDYSSIYLSNTTSGAGEYAGSLQYGHADNSLRIGTNGVERLRISGVGTAIFNNSAQVGGASYGNVNGLLVETAGGIRATNNTSSYHLFRGYTTGNPTNTSSITSDGTGTFSKVITTSGISLFKAGLAEKSNRVASTLGSSPNNSITDGNIIFFAGGSESGNLTINFTDIHANLAEHECCSFTVVITPNNSGKITTVTIDGQTPADGLKWSGGSAPSAGASGVDIYTFTIRKYGTANTNYGVYGAATNYA